MVDRGQDEKADKAERSYRHDDLLSRLLLRKRAAAHPPRQERGILLHQVERDHERHREINRQERPGLPVVKRARRDEQQRSHHDKENREPAECFLLRGTHATILARDKIDRALYTVGRPATAAAFPRTREGPGTPSRRSRRECRPRLPPAPPPRHSRARPRRRRPGPRNRDCAANPTPWSSVR